MDTQATAIVRRVGEGVFNRAFDLPRTLIILPEEVGGSFSQWVEEVPAGGGPPMHVHHRERELFRVLAGRFRFWCQDEVVDLKEGDTVLVPSGARHTFKNNGASEGKLLVTMMPGGFEQFFLEVENRGLHPSRDMAAIVEAAARFGVEFVGPPPE